MPDLHDDIASLQALFDDSPDAIMVEHFDPPIPQSVGNNDATEYAGTSIVCYSNPAFAALFKSIGISETHNFSADLFNKSHDSTFDESFKRRWRGRTQQVIDNMHLSNHYLDGVEGRSTLMLSTTPITQNGLITGCWTRLTDARNTVDQEIEEQRAMKQIDAFVRTENAAIVCLQFETPLPTTVTAQQLATAYQNSTVTVATDALAKIFDASPEVLLDKTVKSLNNPRVNRLIGSGFPQRSAEKVLNLDDPTSLVVVVDIKADPPLTYRVNPTFSIDNGLILEAWIRIEDVTGEELRAREQKNMERTRALAMSAASLHQFESKWVDGKLRIEGPAWESLGLDKMPTDLAGWRELMHPGNMSLSEQEIQDVFDGKTEELNFIVRLPTKSGEEAHIEVWGLISPNEVADQPANSIGLFRDVTQNEKLRARLREKKTLEGLGVLAGGIAHDFNNLLMSVLGYAELMEADLLEAAELESTKLKQSSLQNIEEIRVAALRASELCTSLLAYAGQHLVEKKNLDLSQLVRSTAELVEVTIGKRVPLVLNLDDETPISADRGQLTRVIINLVANAADAMEGYNGAVRLGVTTRVLTDSERALLRDQLEFPEQRMVCFTVSDSGRGMSRETQQRIYEPFFTTKEEGRGLGMAAVHGIVKNHNGGILLHSVEGAGTDFTICLPLLDQSTAAEQPAMERPAQKLARPRVLVVDDEAGVRTIAAEMLRHLNCEVAEADSAEAALGLLGKQEFDHALVDITMPVMSGTELAELLIERMPKLKVVLCSGYTDKDLPEALLARCAFIHKPFTLKEVSDTLELEQVVGEDVVPV